MATIVNVALSLIMIPALGIVGAALGVTASLIVWNVILALWVYRRLSIHSTALGRMKN